MLQEYQVKVILAAIMLLPTQLIQAVVAVQLSLAIHLLVGQEVLTLVQWVVLVLVIRLLMVQL